MDKKIIYLDHAAATPIDERVLKSMAPYYSEKFYNPSSPYLPAIEVRNDYEQAKKTLASLIGAKPDEIVITAGATESVNLAFRSVNGHIIVSAIEHPAVLACASQHENTIIEVDAKGLVSVDSIQAAIRPETELVSVGLANNEIGTIQPIRDIAEVVRKESDSRLKSGNKRQIYLHCDASQCPGQLDVNTARLGVDMLTINSAKIYGPKQVGLLWTNTRVKLTPLIVGGGQERGLRSGTENIAGVIGFAKALELVSEHRNFEVKKLGGLRDSLQKQLTDTFPKAVVSGHLKHRLSNFLHISFPGLDGERLVFLLENRGVLVATGSACAASKGKRSHVLEAIGLEPKFADGSLRITLGHLSNEENTKRAGEIIIEEVTREYERIGL